MPAESNSLEHAANTRVYVDAHVHIHEQFDPQEFLSAAATNFAAHAEDSDARRCFVICLTESAGDDKFSELARLAESRGVDAANETGPWKFEKTADNASLLAKNQSLGDICVIAGRQIVTAERIEVLALGTTVHWPDGVDAVTVIEDVTKAGAVAVVPWGFGKWMGKRRSVVRNLIGRFSPGKLSIGDNSGRAGFIPEPAEFALARGKGYKLISGTDPLPFRSERGKVGSFGFHFSGTIDKNRPWAALRHQLLDPSTPLTAFGELESPLRFIRNQVAMQYVSRTRIRN